MIGPKKDDPAQQFTLRNSQGKDVRFTGWKLGEVNNYNPDAVDKSTNTRSGSARWKERAVYQTEGGNVVCHKLGCSQMPGEVDRGEVAVLKKASLNPEAEEFLRRRGASGNSWADEPVMEFFRGDSLAKDLFEVLQIADVENVD